MTLAFSVQANAGFVDGFHIQQTARENLTKSQTTSSNKNCCVDMFCAEPRYLL